MLGLPTILYTGGIVCIFVLLAKQCLSQTPAKCGSWSFCKDQLRKWNEEVKGGWKSLDDNYVPQDSWVRNTQWRNAISTPPPPPLFGGGRKNPRDSQNDTWLDIRVGVLTCAPAMSTFVPSHGNFSFPGNTDPRRSLRRVSLKVEIFRLWGRG